MPARSTALMCTNTSLPPLSGWMKPKPFVALNHLTVPVVIVLSPRCANALGPHDLRAGLIRLNDVLGNGADIGARSTSQSDNSNACDIGCFATIARRFECRPIILV